MGSFPSAVLVHALSTVRSSTHLPTTGARLLSSSTAHQEKRSRRGYQYHQKLSPGPRFVTALDSTNHAGDIATAPRGKASLNIFSKEETEPNNDYPLGPPQAIRDLPTRGRVNIEIERPYFDPSFEDFSKPQQHSYNVKRIARNSDVFLLKGFLTEWECEAIMDEAKNHYEGGMKKALSQDDKVSSQTRTNCNVAWLGDSRLGGICGMIGEAIEDTFISDQVKHDPLSKRSDLQVLNYQQGGKFVLHHDSHDRMLTVITYLNGVGETWLPLVDVFSNTKESDNNNVGELNSLEEAVGQVHENNMTPGSTGILVSGSIKNKKRPSHLLTADMKDISMRGEENNPHVVSVDKGDAIAFYSYQGHNGKKDWRSIHAGLPVDYKGEQGKWIATSWFHAPSLTTA